MEPSGFMISQMTPPGSKPAMRARSTDASVCPARTSTPPARERNGKTWPGRARSDGFALDRMATRMVCARSAAEIPVVTPSVASIDSQKGRSETRSVVSRHQRQMQRVAAFGSQRQTDQSAAVCGHEVNGLRRDALGGHGEVALIFAVFIVDYHQHAPSAHLLNGLGNGGERLHAL